MVSRRTAESIGLFLIFLTLCRGTEARAQERHRLHGTVVSDSTGAPLPSTNIRILGSSRGTISNRIGAFLMRVPEGPQEIVFSFVGFLSDTLRHDFRGDLEYHVRLIPTVLENPTIVVRGADPAEAIVRRAIAAKETLRQGLTSYRFEAYTRRTISREDSIAGIVESYTLGYWRKGEPLREQIRQERATENLPEMMGLSGVFQIQDFSLDDVQMAGNRYVGPLHPDAIRWYEYDLIAVNLRDAQKIYEIAMEPKSKLVPLLEGTISIADSSWALVGVDLVPAEAIVFPFINDLQIHWQQDFRLEEQGYWLPSDVRMEGGATIQIGPIKIPRIGFWQTSILYDYEVNAPIPDSLFERDQQVVTLPEASSIDSTFWTEHEVFPLTLEEEVAYASLDSTMTLERQFAPPGFNLEAGEGEISLFAGGSGKAAEFLLQGLDTWYSRVEGYHLGYRVSFDSLAGRGVELTARGGKGLSSGRWSWEMSLETTTGRRGVGLGIDLYDRVARSPDAGFYPTLLNSLTTLLGKVDYPDYYASRGWMADLRLGDRFESHLRLYFASERHTPLEVVTNYSLFQRDKRSRPNPAAEEGDLDRLGVRAQLGRVESAAGVMTGRGISVWAERGSGTLVGVERSYTRVDAVASYTIPTVTSRFFFPPQLVLRLGAGWSSGHLPRQLWGAPESALGVYGPLGALRGAGPREYAGTHYVVLTAEHNFRNLLFLLLGLRGISETGIEILAHGAVARSWRRRPGSPFETLPADRPYAEAGIGLGRVWDLFRIDLTRRFTDPRRWRFTIALTTFF